jgi:hypothetical protein
VGREIRRVPPNWEHPKHQVFNHRTNRLEEQYLPLRKIDVQTAWNGWFADFLEFNYELQAGKHGKHGYDKTQPYLSFCDWYGKPPDPKHFRPAWPEETATWYQVYETVSEGTPVTPPFATKEELVDYLCTHGDFWDQARRMEGKSNCGPWSRKNAEAFVQSEWAPSMVIERNEQGVTIKEPRDGI